MDRPLVSVVAMAALALALGIAPSLTAQEAADTVAPEPAATGEATWPARLAPALAAKAAGEPVTASRWMIAGGQSAGGRCRAPRCWPTGAVRPMRWSPPQAVLGAWWSRNPRGWGVARSSSGMTRPAARSPRLTGGKTAPMAATPQLFQDATGEPLGFFDAVVGGRSVGTPGTPALMQAAHDRWGTLEWPGLFDRAIDLAEGGFAVSPRAGRACRRRCRTAVAVSCHARLFPAGRRAARRRGAAAEPRLCGKPARHRGGWRGRFLQRPRSPKASSRRCRGRRAIRAC
jgi:gamma-glutamyltranspeptidase/glutathione hydrolase